MALPATKKLLERAKAGEKLSHKERRQCLAFLAATQPDLTNVELAEIFGITERMIRFDRKAIATELAKEFAGLDPTVIVADLLIMRDNVLVEIQKSMKFAPMGSRRKLDHLLALQNVNITTVKALQDLGVLPKELGHLQSEHYEFKAYVIKDAQVVTRRLDMFDDKPKQAALPAPDEKDREALDAEYLDIPSQPPVLEPVTVSPNAPKETSDTTERAGDSQSPADENPAGSIPTPASP